MPLGAPLRLLAPLERAGYLRHISIDGIGPIPYRIILSRGILDPPGEISGSSALHLETGTTEILTMD
jgi:hypothetical protein